MRQKLLLAACLACLLACLLAPAAGASETMQYSYAQIYLTNSTIDLIPSTSANGWVNGIKCNFPSTNAVKVIFTLDGTVSSFTIDPTFFERESNGAGQYLSGWINFNGGFASSVHVQLNNTGLGTAVINCWASWVTQ